MQRIEYIIHRALFAMLLLPAMPVLAQQGNASELTNQFDQYRKKSLQEKMYVHTDKSTYLAGEILWFKVYNVEASAHKPVDVSKVAYAELLDQNNKPLMQAKLSLKRGKGNGSFFLPASINTGTYKFRAYTSWMKNFGPGYFFEKPVIIINSLKTMGHAWADTTLAYDVQFFPEGGNMVKGLESKIAFKVTDHFGHGVAFSGSLFDENNDTLLRFAPFKFGMGQFSFTPTGDHRYKAAIKFDNGNELIRDLPAVYNQGYVMGVKEDDNGYIKVTVKENMQSNSQPQAILFVHTGTHMVSAESKSFTNGEAVFTIDRSKLGDGISKFTVFNEQQQALCERLYCKIPAPSLTLQAKSDAQQYANRKKVSITVKANANNSVSNSTDMSLAVYRIDSLTYNNEDNIDSYFWLSSDLKGFIESPSYYLSNAGPEANEALDNLMLTHGWRRFKWDDIVSRGDSAFKYMPEFDGHIVTGKITNSPGVPVRDLHCFLSIPGSQIQFYSSLSDEQGFVHFDVRDYYGQNNIVMQLNVLSSSNYKIDIFNPFSEEFSNEKLPHFDIPDQAVQELNAHSINMQVVNAYTGTRLSQFAAPDIDSLPFFGTHCTTYMLDDYVRFSTVEEILREYVPAVAIRRSGGELHLFNIDLDRRELYSNDPLILLDGVPVTSQKILAYDPLKIKKLQVLDKIYVNDEFTYDGVVSFTTYNGNMEDLQLDGRSSIMDYEGLQLEREFYSPQYATEKEVNSRMPDFRSLLYWSPEIHTDSSGNAHIEFYTSDISGKYLAVFQGMDDAGNAGSTKFSFEVKGK